MARAAAHGLAAGAGRPQVFLWLHVPLVLALLWFGEGADTGATRVLPNEPAFVRPAIALAIERNEQ